MADKHPIFESPENTNCKIWQYMDFTKYIALIQTRSLFFPRADKLGDPFEGSFSMANVQMRPIVYKDLLKEAQGRGLEDKNDHE